MRTIRQTTCCVMMLVLLGADAPATAPATPAALIPSLRVSLGGGISMEFILVKPGSFMMGPERAHHQVTITRPFYLGKFEVTQAQWEAVMGNNPSRFKNPTNPVDSVTWEECQSFTKMLGDKVSGRTFALPTEAQWEYACRAGTTTIYSFGNPVSVRNSGDLDLYAWFVNTAEGKTHPVGQKLPNPWGLYDMHGNVWEWCADWDDAYAGEATDPTGPEKGTKRILRGGAWRTGAGGLSSYFRLGQPPDTRSDLYGVRVVYLPPSALARGGSIGE